jgi:hypothetical protein
METPCSMGMHGPKKASITPFVLVARIAPTSASTAAANISSSVQSTAAIHKRMFDANAVLCGVQADCMCARLRVVKRKGHRRRFCASMLTAVAFRCVSSATLLAACAAYDAVCSSSTSMQSRPRRGIKLYGNVYSCSCWVFLQYNFLLAIGRVGRKNVHDYVSTVKILVTPRTHQQRKLPLGFSAVLLSS